MIVLSNDEIMALADMETLVRALRDAFQSGSEAPARLHDNLPGGDGAKLLVMPAWNRREAIGVKVVAVVPSNKERGRPTIDGVYVLLDGKTGEPIAILGAAALTALRTAAVCALAASILSRSDARVHLMVGAGALAPHIIRAICGVRHLERVVIWGRDFQKATALAGALSDLPVELDVASDLSACVAIADIITAATPSTAPLIRGGCVAPGAHVALVGSFSPDMKEADEELFRRGRLVVDTTTAFDESGDLITPLAHGLIARSAPTLSRVLQRPSLQRRGGDEITIFKTVGTGLADLAVARQIVEAASTRDLRPIGPLSTPLAIG